eukprot:TRINITY_DN38618_c0_g1_i1.p2 TRINITY_DN38618_c0_g1~~TRINITY_DN38618_c0_g1_i1.p2  ORF type:complete len:228 (+),score=55.98 TRINITY_DN38618_c0_g1_i1:81-764(+)
MFGMPGGNGVESRSMNVGNKIGSRRSVTVNAPPGGRCSVQLGHEEAAPVVWDDAPPATGQDYISKRTEHARSSYPFGVSQGAQHKNRAAVQAAADDRLRAAPFVTDSHRAQDCQQEAAPSQRQHYYRGQQQSASSTPWGTSADMKAPPATPSRRTGGYNDTGRRPDTAGILTWQEEQADRGSRRSRPDTAGSILSWEEEQAPNRPSSSAGGRQRYPPGRGVLSSTAW